MNLSQLYQKRFILYTGWQYNVLQDAVNRLLLPPSTSSFHNRLKQLNNVQPIIEYCVSRAAAVITSA